MRLHVVHAALLTALVVVSASPAGAIVIRHDVPDSSYRVSASDYPELVVLFEPGDCHATLIHESFLITAAHCTKDNEEPLEGKTIYFRGATDWSFSWSWGQSIPRTIVKVHQHDPPWNDDDNIHDIALLELDRPVTDITPVALYRGSEEVGKQITLVGRGTTATGEVGEEGGSIDGNLRAATNTVTSASSYYIRTDFDDPRSADLDADAPEGGVVLEGVGAAGDSGAPAYIVEGGTRYVAGLNGYGEGPAGEDANIAKYGSRDFHTRVSRYATWVDTTIAAAIAARSGAAEGDKSTGGVAAAGEAVYASGCSAAGGATPQWLLLLCGLES